MSANDAEPLTGAQCRAARALTDVSREMLSEKSNVDESVISGFERRTAEPDAPSRRALKLALESFGAVFLSDDSHGGQGVRLKFSAVSAARIDNLENEGGPTDDDDVAP